VYFPHAQLEFEVKTIKSYFDALPFFVLDDIYHLQAPEMCSFPGQALFPYAVSLPPLV
jgi:hypothetical protein